MQKLSLKIINKTGAILAECDGNREVNLFYNGVYQEGNRIVLSVEAGEENGQYVWLQLDDALGKSLVYLTGDVEYKLPFGEKRTNLSPKVFAGDKHLLAARMARPFEIAAYQNLAINVCDQHNIKNMYPHAVANVETRGEAVFAAQNAIDGVTANHSHGDWPYASWGINRRDDAVIRIDFGREVCVDRIILYLRADFPHDNWWQHVSFVCSDGSRLEMDLNKTDLSQELCFAEKKISWIEMCDMKKSQEESPFPALAQIEVFGVNIGHM